MRSPGGGKLGVVLTPAAVQDEGLDLVLDNIANAGATAISPTLGVYVAGHAQNCLAYVYSYRPAAEFGRVLEAVLASEATGCWVQRYGYLSDEKLAIMRSVWPG